MAKPRNPNSARRCRYANCRRTLRQYDGEPEVDFLARTTCDDYCAEQCKKTIMWSHEPKDRDFYAERTPWPNGVQFDSLSFAPMYGKVPRPETHRPGESSASWAVGGGDV